jgi:hypothetical protein
VVLAGVVGLTAGAGLLTAGSALASNGSQPGKLVLAPASGASSLTPTWSTKDGCPAGFQGSAQLSEFNTNGTYASAISSVVQSPVAAFHGTLLGDIRALLGVTNIKKGGTIEFAIGCYSGVATSGKVKYVQSTFVTLSSSGSSYSTRSSAGKSQSTSPDPSSTPTGSGVGVPIDVQVTGATSTSTPTSTPTVSAAPTPSPTATSTSVPAGAPATGAGGASRPSSNVILIALGATALAGSGVVTGLAIRRRRSA